MPVIKKEGKDTIIFATKEDHATPSKVDLPEPEPSPGLILPNGEINWNCPCLGGMATGPCGLEFREAFSCFHYSNTEPRGSDCYGAFKSMQECMVQYPSIYKHDKETEDELEEAEREMDELERLKKEQKTSEGNVEQVKNTPSEPGTSNEKEVVKAQ